MTKFTRRRFLRDAALGAATFSLPRIARGRIQGANDTIRVGVIGLRGRGGDHIQGFSALPGVKITAVSDCDSDVLAAAAERFRKQGQTVEAYADLRRLLDSKNVDVVSTATPNHWHSLIVVWACQAGKDVYVEKPISHNVWEGRQA